MKENILDVLIYLFEHYMFDDDVFEQDQAALARDLSRAGFDHNMIAEAFRWLENLPQSEAQNRFEPSGNSPAAIRHYSDAEQDLLTVEARGLLLSLEHCGVLDPVSREMVIEQFIALGTDSVEIEHLKWVILMVLINYCDSDSDSVSELTELLVLDGLHACMH